MDANLIGQFATDTVICAMARRGVSVELMLERLSALGTKVSTAEFHSTIHSTEMPVSFFLKCLLALEVRALQTDELIGYMKTLSCPSCAPYEELPPLPPAPPPHDEPIPF